MDWIRRNWPDLLIGLALILVISGIIITLLNGGTFNPFGQRGVDTGAASLPSRPTINEEATPEAQTQLGAESDTDISVLPLPSVGDQNTGDQVDTAVGNALSDSADTAVEAASENLSETADEVDAATQGVLPDPNEAILNDPDSLASDTEVADSSAVGLDAVAVDTATDSASTTDSATLDDVAEQAGGVEAVLPDDSSGLDNSDAASTIQDSSADLADTATELADTGLEDSATSANVAASSSSDAPYRVSAGSFGVAANAEALASELRAANYPVFTARQGDLTIVLVGPYDDSAQAEQVARQIESDGLAPGTEVYEFDPSVEEDTAVSSEAQTSEAQVAETQIQDEAVASEAVSSDLANETQTAEAQATETQAEVVVVAPAETVSEAEAIVDEVTQDTAAQETAAQGTVAQENVAQENVAGSSTTDTTEALAVGGSPTNVNVPPTAETGSYLQVGAYGSIESSNPQRRALEDLGFTVLYVEEQGLVKLLVGPYDGQNVATAKSQLGSQGIASFIR